MTLIAFASARQVFEHRRIVRALVAAAAVLPFTAVAMRAEHVVPASIHVVNSSHLVLTSPNERPVVAIRLNGLVGSASDIYFAKHELVLDGQTIRHVKDFRLLPEDGGVSLLLYRPRSAATLELRLDPDVQIDDKIRAVFLEPRIDWRNPLVRRLSQADTLVTWGGARDAERRECPGAQPRVGMHPASDGEFVRLAYRVLLGREADELGFVAHCEALTSGRVNRRQLVEGLVTSAEFMARER